MKVLFNGEVVSQVINANLKEMEDEIKSLDCKSLVSWDAGEVETEAERIAKRYAPRAVPILDRTKIEKTADQRTEKRFMEVPYTGDPAYFDYSANGILLNQYASQVTPNKLILEVEVTSFRKLEEAERQAEKMLDNIERNLSCVSKDVYMHFSLELIKESALYQLQKKQGECKKLSAGGYSVR